MGKRAMVPSRATSALRGVAFLFVVMGIVAAPGTSSAGEVDTVPTGRVINAAGTYNMDPWAAANMDPYAA